MRHGAASGPSRRVALAVIAARTVALALIAAVAASGCSHLVLLHDPLTAPEHNDLGVAYESSGEIDHAASEYRAALRLDRHFERARVNLGNVEVSRGRWKRAERCFRAALADSAADADALNNLAVVLLRQRKSAEARVLAERAVQIGGARDSIYRATLDEAKASP
ncbi:MAG TPA: tetratricopeptide repeat protein [Candidatus Udaeobacter sp.]|jgi:Flp pilus assembly protein TadD|nr:tetratricopeptide repeat protein [Candidatus Udaeobacter sp.]